MNKQMLTCLLFALCCIACGIDASDEDATTAAGVALEARSDAEHEVRAARARDEAVDRILSDDSAREAWGRLFPEGRAFSRSEVRAWLDEVDLRPVDEAPPVGAPEPICSNDEPRASDRDERVEAAAAVVESSPPPRDSDPLAALRSMSGR